MEDDTLPAGHADVVLREAAPPESNLPSEHGWKIWREKATRVFTREQRSGELRWRGGALQQLFHVYTVYDGIPDSGTEEWRDVPTVDA
jgi:hypothetical protein